MLRCGEHRFELSRAKHINSTATTGVCSRLTPCVVAATSSHCPEPLGHEVRCWLSGKTKYIKHTIKHTRTSTPRQKNTRPFFDRRSMQLRFQFPHKARTPPSAAVHTALVCAAHRSLCRKRPEIRRLSVPLGGSWSTKAALSKAMRNRSCAATQAQSARSAMRCGAGGRV